MWQAMVICPFGNPGTGNLEMRGQVAVAGEVPGTTGGDKCR